MYHDYIIARRRIRMSGPQADLERIGLPSFGPFAAEYDPDAETAAEIETGVPIDAAALKFEELTRFDFNDGTAECIFGRDDDSYVFIIEDGQGTPTVFVYDIASCRAQSNMGATERFEAAFARFGIWFMTNIATAPYLTSAVHTSTLVYNGEAVMFLGESGTGKSTHTRLWRENIVGTTLLNDDSPFIAVADGRPEVFGSPWSGKTHCYKNEHYPLRAVVRLSQAPHNAIRRLRGAHAVGALLPSLPPAFAFDKRLEEFMIDTLSAAIAAVPVYHLECLPDAAAAHLAHDTIFGA